MKLLIISGFYFDYGLTVAKAFQDLGHEINYCGYSLSNKGFTGIFRYSLLGRLGYDPQISDRRKFIEETKRIFSTYQPDGILVLRGTKRDFYSEIIKDCLGRFNKKPKTAVWLLDEIKHIEGGLTGQVFFDNWFTLEPADIPLLKKEWGITGQFLPVGYDSSCYRVLSDNESSQGNSSDISFVGSIGYKIRLQYLEHLAKNSYENNLKLVAITSPINFPRIKLRNYPFLKKCLSQENCDHQRNNLIYNNSKVNLNIHGDYALEAVNPRFFEILGSGGVQLVEPKEAQRLLGFEPDKDFLAYTSLEELDEKIKFVFDNPDKAREIAISGHKKVKNYDYLSRAKFIMDQAFSG